MAKSPWRIRSFWCTQFNERRWRVYHYSPGYGWFACAETTSHAAALEQIRWRETTTYEERLEQSKLNAVPGYTVSDVLIDDGETRDEQKPLSLTAMVALALVTVAAFLVVAAITEANGGNGFVAIGIAGVVLGLGGVTFAAVLAFVLPSTSGQRRRRRG